MTNPEIFNLVACRVFDAVMSSFPLPASLVANDIMRGTESNNPDDLFYYSVIWLERHGYIDIQAKELGSSQFHMVFPTEKCLVVMNAIPDALKPSGKTLREHLKECLGNGTSQAVSDAIKTLFAAGISLL